MWVFFQPCMTRIAIVDDSPLFRHGFIILLQQLNCTISIEAEKAQELIDRLGIELPPDLIFLDTQLADMDSYSVLQYIRIHHPNIPVIVLHGRSNFHILWQLLRGGAYTHLSKTATVSVVRRTIEEALFNRLPEKAEN
jgi:DNA-binding NarL/FixJ family response regulator